MAKLKEGSVILKNTGEEIIATVEDIKRNSIKIHIGDTPPEGGTIHWIDTSL